MTLCKVLKDFEEGWKSIWWTSAQIFFNKRFVISETVSSVYRTRAFLKARLTSSSTQTSTESCFWALISEDSGSSFCVEATKCFLKMEMKSLSTVGSPNFNRVKVCFGLESASLQKSLKMTFARSCRAFGDKVKSAVFISEQIWSKRRWWRESDGQAVDFFAAWERTAWRTALMSPFLSASPRGDAEGFCSSEACHQAVRDGG